MLESWWCRAEGGQRGRGWENCNSIINKIYFKKKKKTTKTKPKQTPRTGIESEKWTSHGGSLVGRGRGGIGGKRYPEEEA